MEKEFIKHLESKNIIVKELLDNQFPENLLIDLLKNYKANVILEYVYGLSKELNIPSEYVAKRLLNEIKGGLTAKQPLDSETLFRMITYHQLVINDLIRKVYNREIKTKDVRAACEQLTD